MGKTTTAVNMGAALAAAGHRALVVDCDPQSVLPGMEVSLEFRKVRREGKGGILCNGYKAVPRS